MSSNATCPYCQSPLNVTEAPTGQPVVCPHCLTNIANPQLAPAGEAPNLLRDIRRSRPIGWVEWLVLLLCVVLCVAQIIYVKIEHPHYQFDRSENYWLGFLGLDFLALVAIGRGLWRYFIPGRESVTDNRVLGVLVLALLLGLAVAVFFCAVCLAVA